MEVIREAPKFLFLFLCSPFVFFVNFVVKNSSSFRSKAFSPSPSQSSHQPCKTWNIPRGMLFIAIFS
jgi:hypothetical protein